ncbi:uncharacterized protein BO88DRAFT_476761 [Aspergillus vadensis CBS 113365]|uniref:Uncharacterized protein n=1 Tax=Aspergillus vadensis (strain CBS 113365 / IMI 142717 / IBT 24658) TaxID=1448311 RepID=A0A319CA21_ASPVC|nr:hypothetical protein BO88DRAFT_476761 [Aspergillus vadensis CBS 113365]PYH72218.1 hypothetical protein BO88DRAFT_476761 [Aspergillus vadensis CBS 113365]
MVMDIRCTGLRHSSLRGRKGPFLLKGSKLYADAESPTALGRSDGSKYTNDSGSRLSNYCKPLSNWRLLQPANLEYLQYTKGIRFLMQINGGTCYNPEALWDLHALLESSARYEAVDTNGMPILLRPWPRLSPDLKGAYGPCLSVDVGLAETTNKNRPKLRGISRRKGKLVLRFSVPQLYGHSLRHAVLDVGANALTFWLRNAGPCNLDTCVPPASGFAEMSLT